MLMGAMTPMHIPFWIGWSTILFTKKILKADNLTYYIYIIGIGIGTFLANCLFIFGGKYIVDLLNTNQRIFNLVIGGIFAIIAIIQLVKILWYKDDSDKLAIFGKE